MQDNKNFVVMECALKYFKVIFSVLVWGFSSSSGRAVFDKVALWADKAVLVGINEKFIL